MAVIFIPLLFIPSTFFAGVVSVFVLLASLEFYKMIEKSTDNVLAYFVFFLATLSMYLSGILYIFGSLDIELLLAVLMGHMIIFLALRVFYASVQWTALFQGGIYLGFSFFALVYIHDAGLMMLLYLLLIAMLSDIFAYFSGMVFGKHKLAPSISPKKTIEGMIGGTFMAVLIASPLAIMQTLFFENHTVFQGLLVVLFGLLVSLLAQLGDLVASSLKRQYDIKDFSNLFPGHGGILDRFDSTLFAASILTIVLMVIAVM